jgi:hypothetical protein
LDSVLVTQLLLTQVHQQMQLPNLAAQLKCEMCGCNCCARFSWYYLTQVARLRPCKYSNPAVNTLKNSSCYTYKWLLVHCAAFLRWRSCGPASIPTLLQDTPHNQIL